jgi:hypothetical protein
MKNFKKKLDQILIKKVFFELCGITFRFSCFTRRFQNILVIVQSSMVRYNKYSK